MHSERNLHTNAFIKAEQNLQKKKEKLLKQDVNKWEIKPEHYSWISEMVSDKNLAIKYMLPKETEDVKKLWNNHIFLTN